MNVMHSERVLVTVNGVPSNSGVIWLHLQPGIVSTYLFLVGRYSCLCQSWRNWPDSFRDSVRKIPRLNLLYLQLYQIGLDFAYALLNQKSEMVITLRRKLTIAWDYIFKRNYISFNFVCAAI